MNAVSQAVSGSRPAELFHRCIQRKVPLMVLTPANTPAFTAKSQQSLYPLLAAASREAFGNTDTLPELAADHCMALVGGIADGCTGVRLGSRLAQLIGNECQSANSDDKASNGPLSTVGVTMGRPLADIELDRYHNLSALAALSAVRGGTLSHAVSYRSPGILAATLKRLEFNRDSRTALQPQIAPMIDDSIRACHRHWRLPQPQIAHCVADLRQRWLAFEKSGKSVGLISLRLDGLSEWRDTPKSAAFVAHMLHLSNEFLIHRQHRVGSTLYYIDHGEYALLVPGLDYGEADVIASMLQQSLLQKLMEHLPYEPPLSLALGVGVATATPQKRPDSLMQLAQESDLYLAINTVEICEAAASDLAGRQPETAAQSEETTH